MLARICLILRPGEQPEEEESADEIEVTKKPSDTINKEKAMKSLGIVQNVFSDFEYGGHKWHFPSINPDSDKVKLQGVVVEN